MRILSALLIPCVVLVIASREARAQQRSAPTAPRGERVRISGEVGFAVFLPSRYGEALGLFGHGHLAVGTSLAVRATTRLAEVVVLGGRAGLLHTGSLRAAPAAVHYNLVDASVVFGLGTRWRPRRDSVLVEAVLEAGGVLGDASLNDVGQRITSLRLGGSALVGWNFNHWDLYLGVRSSGSYTPWNGAGGSFWDPAFANVTAALELGGVR